MNAASINASLNASLNASIDVSGITGITGKDGSSHITGITGINNWKLGCSGLLGEIVCECECAVLSDTESFVPVNYLAPRTGTVPSDA